MDRKIKIWLLAFGAIFIGFYPLTYFLVDIRFGLLQTKSVELLKNMGWQIGFYTHILSGGIALLVGWSQFIEKIRLKQVNLHRNLGKIYVFFSIVGGLSGLFIGFYATGGFISGLGFILLALIWLISTGKGYQFIRLNKIKIHEEMMTYSYAACFAAVTLRIWLPILILLTNDFMIAYKIVAWLCWIPNILWAYYFNNERKRNSLSIKME